MSPRRSSTRLRLIRVSARTSGPPGHAWCRGRTPRGRARCRGRCGTRRDPANRRASRLAAPGISMIVSPACDRAAGELVGLGAPSGRPPSSASRPAASPRRTARRARGRRAPCSWRSGRSARCRSIIPMRWAVVPWPAANRNTAMRTTSIGVGQRPVGERRRRHLRDHVVLRVLAPVLDVVQEERVHELERVALEPASRASPPGTPGARRGTARGPPRGRRGRSRCSAARTDRSSRPRTRTGRVAWNSSMRRSASVPHELLAVLEPPAA